jgi:SHS2 domain-containing protein
MTIYKLLDHTADLGIEITGRTKRELFANAAFALFDILIQDTDNKGKAGRKTGERVKIRTVSGADVEDLLINFLRELLYLFNGMGFVVNQGMIADCSMKRLVVKLTVEPYDPKRHLIKTELKAVTYHGLAVEKTKKGWKARVIFDV